MFTSIVLDVVPSEVEEPGYLVKSRHHQKVDLLLPHGSPHVLHFVGPRPT